jgi:hypothetical protein
MRNRKERIMYATATQSTVKTIRHTPAPLRDSQQAPPKQTATFIHAAFMEQHGAGRLEELAETLDFPLDFQI